MTSLAKEPPGHYRFGHVARMEWIKLRTLRSTWWTLAITTAGAVAIAVAVGLNTKNAAGDLTNNALAGMIPGLLFAGVLGVLVVTGEYTAGMIRATLAAIPRRPWVLAAKAAVFGAVALVLGEAATFLSFFAGGAALRHGIQPPDAEPAGCATGGRAERGRLLPDRAARRWTWRDRPAHRGGRRGAGRRRVHPRAGGHPPGTTLHPVAALTPFGPLQVATFPGTFAAFAAGAAMLLAAPWVALSLADRWLMSGLLGPGRLAQRVADLEHTRAVAVDDSAALLRRLERDLHDGAQIRLATLAMNLGMAKEKLGGEGEVLDAAAARELVDAAHRNAKDALIELRGLARGIHPPSLDNGLADALATLAADSVIPAELEVDIPVRPRPRSRPSPISARPSCWPTPPSTAPRTRSRSGRRGGRACCCWR